MMFSVSMRTKKILMWASLLCGLQGLVMPVSWANAQPGAGQIIPSRSVRLTPAEQAAGVVDLQAVLPVFQQINERYRIFSPAQFTHYIHNFHYPYRSQFALSQRRPPTQVVLHWTANPRPDIPLYTLSAFLRSRQRGRIVERRSEHKNVSNYFLTGSLQNLQGQSESYLVKLTRGDLSQWGDIPRVTAYPTKDSHNNKYDGQGAVGIEIESPNFRKFYYNAQQREKLDNFLVLVLKERQELSEFLTLRQSPHWQDMQALARYLRNNLEKIDVNARGGIPQKYQHLDAILKDFPDLSPRVYQEAQRMFRYISGHGIVAREYNTLMHRVGRPQDARYHKIDFTEPHVFLVVMELLNSEAIKEDSLREQEALRLAQWEQKSSLFSSTSAASQHPAKPKSFHPFTGRRAPR